MKILHSLELNVFIKQSEDKNMDSDLIAEVTKEELDSFIQKNLKITEEDYEKRRINSELKILEPEGDFTTPLYIVRLNCTKKPEDILKAVLKNLSKEDIGFLKNSVKTRVDEYGNYYLRLDKESFVNNHKLKLVDHGRCVHVKCKVAAFPQSKENAVKVVESILEEF